MKKLYLIAIVAAAVSCNNHSKTEKTASDSSAADLQSEIFDDEADSNIFDRFDLIKQLVMDWNDAINRKNAQVLNTLYADEVSYYLKTVTKQQCLDVKTKWLGEHPSYHQEAEGIEVYYMEGDTDITTFVADFDKVYTDNGIKKRVPSTLCFSKSGDEWKITKETDEPTQLNRAKKSPVIGLPRGEYTFYREYWCDTRGLDDFAHDEVPYRFSLFLKIDDHITGDYSFYSGTMRDWTHHLIIGGKIENGILKIQTIYNENEQHAIDDYPTYAEVTDWHYKIVNPKELVSLDTYNGFLYGKSIMLDK